MRNFRVENSKFLASFFQGKTQLKDVGKTSFLKIMSSRTLFLAINNFGVQQPTILQSHDVPESTDEEDLCLPKPLSETNYETSSDFQKMDNKRL